MLFDRNCINQVYRFWLITSTPIQKMIKEQQAKQDNAIRINSLRSESLLNKANVKHTRT